VTTHLQPDKAGELRDVAAQSEEIRAIERERLRVLMHKDIDVARALHADDF
jgi:hypothetical protein